MELVHSIYSDVVVRQHFTAVFDLSFSAAL